tara:strand:- start:536 stop:874 length:339 start_codon:yes stop_codon:yes gene_type:complete
MSRIEPYRAKLESFKNQDDIMENLIEILSKEVLYPEPGKFYTFIYKSKTPDIVYDEFPLIACTSLERWGFKGFNFHWRKSRNYTWNEVIGKLHVVNYDELDDLNALQYGKFV